MSFLLGHLFAMTPAQYPHDSNRLSHYVGGVSFAMRYMQQSRRSTACGPLFITFADVTCLGAPSMALASQPCRCDWTINTINTSAVTFFEAARISLVSTRLVEMPAFTYRPLLEPNSLRLPRIQPDLDETTGYICLELQETREDSTYCCLSYMWGDQTDRLAILVNGSQMSIGKGLYEFLCNCVCSVRVETID